MHILSRKWAKNNTAKHPEKIIKDEHRKKFILDIIMSVVAIVAMGVSIKSCAVSEQSKINSDKAIFISETSNKIAKDANDISKNALETSQTQFLQINRPYITLAPKKFKDGLYWKLTQKNNAVLMELQYEIKNVGNVAAKNITVPDELAVGPEMKLKKDGRIIYHKLDKVTLGPGADFIISPNVSMHYENEEQAKENLSRFLSEENKGATFLLSVDYGNELDETQKYRTFVQNRIHNDKALILKSEMVIITENE